jgi:hypothetical protein
MLAFKTAVTKMLSPYTSAVLLDPEYSLDAIAVYANQGTSALEGWLADRGKHNIQILEALAHPCQKLYRSRSKLAVQGVANIPRDAVMRDATPLMRYAIPLRFHISVQAKDVRVRETLPLTLLHLCLAS